MLRAKCAVTGPPRFGRNLDRERRFVGSLREGGYRHREKRHGFFERRGMTTGATRYGASIQLRSRLTYLMALR